MRRSSAVVSVISAAIATVALCIGSVRSQPPLTEAPTPVPTTSQKRLDEIATLNRRVRELYQPGKYAEAIPFAQLSLELSEKALGPTHPDVATSLNGLAELYRRTGQYAQALPLHERAL